MCSNQKVLVTGGFSTDEFQVIAHKEITLPCSPYKGLCLIIDGEWTSVCPVPAPVWDCSEQRWEVTVADFTPLPRPRDEWRDLNTTIKWFEAHGWEIDDLTCLIMED